MKFISSISNKISILLINILIACLWGFAGFPKAMKGYPEWFTKTFENTILATFPGLTASFWFITAVEILAFVLAIVSLVRMEFLKDKLPVLRLALLLTLGNFLSLAFGMFLAGDGAGQERLFNYFVLCLMMYAFFDRHEKMQNTSSSRA